MKRVIAFVAAIVSVVAVGDLSRIDADGVTETGGTSSYARMIPRTGSDGKISASFLPPVSSWASQPLARMYYADGEAAEEGNGSSQYPFKTFSNAMANAAAGAVVMFAPASYSGAFTLAGGSNITLFGFGNRSYFSEITVTVSGSSDSTELLLCGVRVDSLVVNGAKTKIRMSGSTVSVLSGNSAGISVIRADMESRVSTVTAANHSDAYVGTDHVSTAYELRDTSSSSNMVFSEGRAVVGSRVVAYVDEIDAATNAVYATLAVMSNEDERIVGLIETEKLARVESEAAIYAEMGTATNALKTQISDIGVGWDTQLSTLSAGISEISKTVSSLWKKETNDVSTLTKSISDVSYAYGVADTNMAGILRTEFESSLSALEERVPDIATECADERIAAVSNSIINTAVTRAVSQADSNAITREDKISAKVTKNAGDISALDTTVTGHTSSIANINTTTDNLSSRITSLSTDVTSKYNTNAGKIKTLEDWKTETITWKGTVNTDIATMKSKINEIIAVLNSIKSGGTWTVPTSL